MNKLTLEQACEKHSTHPKSPVGSILYIHKTDAFKAGAKWQKEQYKELINLCRQLIAAYDFRYPNAKQLLVGYTNEQAFDKLNQLEQQTEH